jgi:predicted CxxxxCH...CXXCH cytochrome family protein
VSHPPEWNDTSAENFHGKKVLAAGNESCQGCHGVDYQGGNSGIACNDCHENYPHPPEWSAPGNDGSHSSYLKAANWQIEECQSCHGENYRGGSSGSSCYDCHTGSKGPESCNVCHGSSAVDDSELYSWAPPKDLANNVLTSNIGVGAHQTHLVDTNYTNAYTRDCDLCHRVPTSFDDPRHRDGIIDIEFNDIGTDEGELSPIWDAGAATCSDTYCHGNFALGNNATVVWNQVNTGQSDCGTCHGMPPTNGHPNNPNCVFCHSSVVDSDNNIIDKTKHINGETDRN